MKNLFCILVLLLQAISGPVTIRGPVAIPAPSSGPTFTWNHTCVSAFSASSLNCTINNSGDMVVVYTVLYGALSPTLSVSDGTHTLTNTPHSPIVNTGGSNFSIFSSYILSETLTGTVTFTITWGGGSNNGVIVVQDIPYTGGAAVFDTDATNLSTSAATPIALPSITPAGAGDFLSGFVWGSTGCTVSATSPWSNGTASPPETYAQDSYINSSASGATLLKFSDTCNPDTWISMAVAFK